MYIQGPEFTKLTRLDGKVVIITGANTGIGFETAIDLAKRGAKVYLACRNSRRGMEAQIEVDHYSGQRNSHFRELDLASMKSIRKFAEDFMKEESRLDILINNAGVMACPKMLTEDGFEMQIGTNHMGHFLLTNLLLDLLKKSAPSRIVNVSSMAHNIGKIQKDDLNSEKDYKPITAYAQSKLANVMFTRSLAKRLEGTDVTAYSLHPGVVKTQLSRHLGESISVLLNRKVCGVLESMFYKTAKAGAQTSIMCAVDPDIESLTGRYFA